MALSRKSMGKPFGLIEPRRLLRFNQSGGGTMIGDGKGLAILKRSPVPKPAARRRGF